MNRLKNVLERVRLCTDWYKLVFPFNRFFKDGACLHVRNGPIMSVRDVFSVDVEVLKEVFTSDVYDIANLPLSSNAVVVDIGANIGSFSAAIHFKYPNAKLVSYEPHPTSFSLLKKNAPFATIRQKAVMGKREIVQIQTLGPSMSRRIVQSGGTPVEAVTLGDALKDLSSIDLLKVDVEGSEYEIFNNTSPQTLKKVKKVFVEVHAKEERDWFFKFFEINGFKAQWSNKDTDILIAERIATHD